jgi:hypothetical protein
VAAIGDMVAPVVLITLATIFANGLMTVGATLANDLLALDRERLDILRGPHGEILEDDTLPPADRDRLTKLGDQILLMTRRFRRIRSAVLISWIAIGLLMLSVAAVTAHSEGFAFTALALVIAGVAVVFAALASVVALLATAGDTLIDQVGRLSHTGGRRDVSSQPSLKRTAAGNG